MLAHKTNDSFRSLSNIFTPSNFRNIVVNSSLEKTISRIKKHKIGEKPRSIEMLLKHFYRDLENNYRNEYVFKNALLNHKLLAEHCLSDTVVLNEFRIGSSIADFVLLNGEIRVFEIKTDLDGFDKLSKQISDYQKVANRVYVVASNVRQPSFSGTSAEIL